jgi:hypothetical protein
LRGGRQEKFLCDDVSGLLKWVLLAGAGVAQVELSAAVADKKLVIHIKHFKPRRNSLLKKENPVASALNFVYLVNK